MDKIYVLKGFKIKIILLVLFSVMLALPLVADEDSEVSDQPASAPASQGTTDRHAAARQRCAEINGVWNQVRSRCEQGSASEESRPRGETRRGTGFRRNRNESGDKGDSVPPDSASGSSASAGVPSPGASGEPDAHVNGSQDGESVMREGRGHWADDMSLRDRAMLGASIGATGIGGMQLAQGLAEMHADRAAASDIAGFMNTIRCGVGGSRNVTYGGIGQTPEESREFHRARMDYIRSADRLRNAREALGLPPGIEAELVIDTSILYTGRGTDTDGFRNHFDTAQERYDSNAGRNRAIAGGAVAVAGVALGIATNLGGDGTDASGGDRRDQGSSNRSGFDDWLVRVWNVEYRRHFRSRGADWGVGMINSVTNVPESPDEIFNRLQRNSAEEACALINECEDQIIGAGGWTTYNCAGILLVMTYIRMACRGATGEEGEGRGRLASVSKNAITAERACRITCGTFRNGRGGCLNGFTLTNTGFGGPICAVIPGTEAGEIPEWCRRGEEPPE